MTMDVDTDRMEVVRLLSEASAAVARGHVNSAEHYAEEALGLLREVAHAKNVEGVRRAKGGR